MARSVPEWIGKTDDQKVPPRVRLRVFKDHNGVCHISGRKIQPGEEWELEHIQSLESGGEHRESNMAPALVEPHKEKTAQESGVRKKVNRTRKKHLGIRDQNRRPIPGSKRSGWASKYNRKTGRFETVRRTQDHG